MHECQRCGRAHKRTIPTYWGQAVCPHCALEASELHDIKGDWPKLPWAGHQHDRRAA